MQLSTSLLPLDLPVANAGAVPAGASTPTLIGALVDFGALLKAESPPSPNAPQASDAILASPTPAALENPNDFTLAEERPHQEQREDEAPVVLLEAAPDPGAEPVPPVTVLAVERDFSRSRDRAASDLASDVSAEHAVEAEEALSAQVTINTARGHSVRQQRRIAAEIDGAKGGAPAIAAGNNLSSQPPSSPVAADAPDFNTASVDTAASLSHRAAASHREATPVEATRVSATNPNAFEGKTVRAVEPHGRAAMPEIRSASKSLLQSDSENPVTETPISPDHASRVPTEMRASVADRSTPVLSVEHQRQTLASANPAPAEPRSSPATIETPKAAAFAAAGMPSAESVARIEKMGTTTDASPAGASPPSTAGSRVPEAKFAVAPSRAPQSPLAVYKSREKTTQIPEQQLVEEASSAVGTNAAKPEAHMPVAASTSSPAPHAVERLSHAVAPVSFDFSPSEEHAEPAELAQATRRAVNAAVAVTEQYAADRQPAVTLKFTVSGVDLGVRVELRGEHVHTTFRTDSPELRAALAQEWNQVAAAQAGDRASRLAEPVFTSNHASASTPSHTNGSSNSDLGSADQRNFQQRQEHAAASEWARSRAASRTPNASSTTTPITAPAARAAVVESSSRLRTFA